MPRIAAFACLVFLAPSLAAIAGAPAAAATAGGAAGADVSQYPHVVELWNSDTTPAETLLGVLTDKLGATREKALAVVESSRIIPPIARQLLDPYRRPSW